MMNSGKDYFHRDVNGQAIQLPVGKAVCVGRNYVEHVQELNNSIPSEPLLFIKPSTSFVAMHEPLFLPANHGECHNEIELAILIRSTLSSNTEQSPLASIWGIGLGLDLTLRDKQTELKQQGLPWERAKAFDGACPVSDFVPIESIQDLTRIHFTLMVQGKLRQSGDTNKMIWSVESLLNEIRQVFTLMPGDIVMTGTPKGVGPLRSGDRIDAELVKYFTVQTHVA